MSESKKKRNCTSRTILTPLANYISGDTSTRFAASIVERTLLKPQGCFASTTFSTVSSNLFQILRSQLFPRQPSTQYRSKEVYLNCRRDQGCNCHLTESFFYLQRNNGTILPASSFHLLETASWVQLTKVAAKLIVKPAFLRPYWYCASISKFSTAFSRTCCNNTLKGLPSCIG